MDARSLETEARKRDCGRFHPAELDDLRVRYLGRKSDLKQALREVRDRESGMTLNAAREAARGRRRRPVRPRSSAPSSDGGSPRSRST